MAKIVLLLICLVFQSVAVADYAENFTEAKKIARLIWAEHRETFYCGCKYDRQGNIDFMSCSFSPKKKCTQTNLILGKAASEQSPSHAHLVHGWGERAQLTQHKIKFGKGKISWEHVVPVSWYGKQRPCWKKNRGQGAREACRKQDPDFRRMEADLHNLVPAVREINMRRKHYAYGELPADTCMGCNFAVNDYLEIVEPRNEVKGMAARITLYMVQKYEISIKGGQKQILMQWNKRFPPTQWEKHWQEKVSVIQGDQNPYIAYYNKYKKRG